MESKLTETLFALLRFEIVGTELCKDIKEGITEEMLPSLFHLAKKHDLAHLIGDVLDKNDLLPEETEAKKRFLQERNMAVYRYEQMQYEFEQICDTLEKAKIPFIPLKGAVLRSLYPEPWMRTSCDIDILVHENDLENVVEMLKGNLGYTCDPKKSHDMQMYAPNGVHLELHYTLIENDILPKANMILSDIWAYTTEERDGVAQKKLTDEAFYFYHIAHMAKHFLFGGCGVKPFLDMWILNHSALIKFDKVKRNDMLSKGGLLKFSEEMEKLSEVWFGQAEYTETIRKIGTYVLQGGVYGTVQNSVAVQQVKKGGKIKYIWSRVWMPYDTLKFRYPSLQRHKWLFPFYQVRRWFHLFSRDKAKQSVRELSMNSNTSKEEQEETLKLLTKLGLYE